MIQVFHQQIETASILLGVECDHRKTGRAKLRVNDLVKLEVLKWLVVRCLYLLDYLLNELFDPRIMDSKGLIEVSQISQREHTLLRELLVL